MAITLIAASAVVGAGASVASGISSSKAAKKAAAAQKGAAEQNYAFNMEQLEFMKGQAGAYSDRVEELLGESRGTVENTYNRIAGIIGNIPTTESLFPQAEGLSRRDFDYRTGIKRENLDFILGGTGDELREVQQFNADLANLEENAFTNRFNKVIRSSMAGLKAATIGEPTGTFANLSAKNLYDFSQQGLSNYLAINDFFAKEGTVDPISPYAIAQDLFTNEFNRAGLNINNEQWRGTTLVGINNAAIGAAGQEYNNAAAIAQMAMGVNQAYTQGIAESDMAKAAASNLMFQGISQGVGQLASGLSTAYGMQLQTQALQQQQANNALLLNKYGLNSLNAYAPGRVPSVGSSPFVSTRTSATAPSVVTGVSNNTAMPTYGGTYGSDPLDPGYYGNFDMTGAYKYGGMGSALAYGYGGNPLFGGN